MDILIDFDGTCVTHEFPLVGRDIGAEDVLRELIANGHRLILFTIRSDKQTPKKIGPMPAGTQPLWGNHLTNAVNWFKQRGIPLYGIQENPGQKLWTTSPKAYGQLMIDDTAVGCPLIHDPTISQKPFADWVKIRELLVEMGVIKNNKQ
jgi:hypothetical protein